MDKLDDILKDHQIICWDIDNTLINGPNSSLFRQWIKSNPDKEHHIVTFRCQYDDIQNIKHELQFDTEDFHTGLFKSIMTMPEEYDLDHIYPHGIRQLAHLDAQEFYDITHGLDKNHMMECLEICNNYKVQACLSVNSMVLVDDLYDYLKPSFDANNLILINALGYF